MKHGDQRKIASAAKVTASHLSAVLKGRTRPSWQVAKRFAKATKTDPVVWLEGTPDEIRAAIDAAKWGRLESQAEHLRAMTDFVLGA